MVVYYHAVIGQKRSYLLIRFLGHAKSSKATYLKIYPTHQLLLNTLCIMAESLFLLPGTPASSSRAPSAISGDSSQPTDSTRPIWIYFRLAEGNEPVFYPIKLKNGRTLNERLYYCLLCEERKAPTIWKNAFV